METRCGDKITWILYREGFEGSKGVKITVLTDTSVPPLQLLSQSQSLGTPNSLSRVGLGGVPSPHGSSQEEFKSHGSGGVVRPARSDLTRKRLWKIGADYSIG